MTLVYVVLSVCRTCLCVAKHIVNASVSMHVEIASNPFRQTGPGGSLPPHMPASRVNLKLSHAGKRNNA